jgi:hypothetical protein
MDIEEVAHSHREDHHRVHLTSLGEAPGHEDVNATALPSKSTCPAVDVFQKLCHLLLLDHRRRINPLNRNSKMS